MGRSQNIRRKAGDDQAGRMIKVGKVCLHIGISKRGDSRCHLLHETKLSRPSSAGEESPESPCKDCNSSTCSHTQEASTPAPSFSLAAASLCNSRPPPTQLPHLQKQVITTTENKIADTPNRFFYFSFTCRYGSRRRDEKYQSDDDHDCNFCRETHHQNSAKLVDRSDEERRSENGGMEEKGRGGWHKIIYWKRLKVFPGEGTDL